MTHTSTPHTTKNLCGDLPTSHAINLFVPTDTFGCFRFPYTMYPLFLQIILLRFLLKNPHRKYMLPHTKSGLWFPTQTTNIVCPSLHKILISHGSLRTGCNEGYTQNTTETALSPTQHKPSPTLIRNYILKLYKIVILDRRFSITLKFKI